jgi:hypothetical protein
LSARFSVRRLTIVVVICLFVSGCGAPTDSAVPAILFTTISEAAVGGAERTAAIAGRVTGARPGQRNRAVRADECLVDTATHRAAVHGNRIRFARTIPSDRGGPNDYDPDNAWTDRRASSM